MTPGTSTDLPMSAKRVPAPAGTLPPDVGSACWQSPPRQEPLLAPAPRPELALPRPPCPLANARDHAVVGNILLQPPPPSAGGMRRRLRLLLLLLLQLGVRL